MGSRTTLSAVAGLVILCLLVSGTAAAASTNWISSSSIRDTTGNSAVAAGQPLLAGDAYNVTVEIQVPFSQQQSQFNVSLNGAVGASGSQYWYVLTPSYGGYNSADFVAGSKTVTFTQVQGELTLAALFSLSSNMTVVQSGGLTLRFPLNNFPLITIDVAGGSQVGNLSVDISDQVIQAYQQAYTAKSTYISSGKISQSYSAFVSGVLVQAQALDQEGLPAQATNLLNVLDSPFPAPPNPFLFYAVAIAAGLFVVVGVALSLVIVRRSSKQGFMKSVVGEVERDLAGTEVKAAQYDKNLAERLRGIREKLGEIQ